MHHGVAARRASRHKLEGQVPQAATSRATVTATTATAGATPKAAEPPRLSKQCPAAAAAYAAVGGQRPTGRIESEDWRRFGVRENSLKVENFDIVVVEKADGQLEDNEHQK